jgi:hypothetical protein
MNDEIKAESKVQDKGKVLDFRTLLKNEKAIKAVVVGGLALVVLMFLSSVFSGDESSRNADADFGGITVAEAEELRLEQKLERAISAIDGVGELTIVVTLESLSETVYAERGSGVRTVIAPRVRGVAIVAQGADNPVVQEQIVELTSRLLGINSTRISVTN